MKSSAAELRQKVKVIGKDVEGFLYLVKLCADKQGLDKLETLPELIPVLCEFRGRGTILANQDPHELEALAECILKKPPSVVVEIGTAKGGTLYLWTRIAARGALVVSIDKPGETGSVGRAALAAYRTFGRDRGARVHTIREDSHSDRAHARLREILGERKVDFLFIDGDHRYEGVRDDFFGYQPYMAGRGVIAMHDIASSPSDPQIEVRRFWSEIQSRDLSSRALISKPGKSPGIGVVFLG